MATVEIELVVMEATGVYWKPVYYGLEDLFDEVWLVNAHHVKNVQGRKTDMSDAQWLADVAAHGMEPIWSAGRWRLSRRQRSSVLLTEDYTRRSTACIMNCMTTPVPTRFTDEELALIDELVNEGVGESRSAVIRRGVHDLAESFRRSRVGATIADSYRAAPQAPEDDELAMASATAMTEAEPW